MPLELLTWYLPTLEDDADADQPEHTVGVGVAAGGGQFFSTYLYTKLLLLAAIMILKSHRCFSFPFSPAFPPFSPQL